MSFWSKVKKFPWKTVLMLGLPLIKSRVKSNRANQAIDLAGQILLGAHGPNLKAKLMTVIEEHDRAHAGLDEQARQARERAT